MEIKEYNIVCHDEEGALIEDITVQGYDNAIAVYNRLKNNPQYFKVQFYDLEYYENNVTKQLH